MQCQEFVYRIQVEGMLDENWSDWLGHMAITRNDGITTLTGTVVDQVALRGVLSRLWDLSMTLLSAIRIEQKGEDDET
jgi:hypothetical protein